MCYTPRLHAFAALALMVFGGYASPCLAAEREQEELLQGAQRIVFLGDSITAGGGYVAAFDAWLLTQGGGPAPLVINMGLSSETVSGLSEEGHADSKFPRPDLAERLDRVLALTKPDLVFACYGINCGIYEPFDDGRFHRYQEGMERFKRKVEAAGGTLVVVTPPSYDDHRAQKPFSYNRVLGRYAEWLLARRADGWTVVDLHGPMTAEVARRRQADPDFTFQPDAVHPNAEGHWFMARQLIRWLGDAEAAGADSPEAMLEARGLSPDVMKLVTKRMTVLRDAHVAAAGHKRPGVRAGLPVPQALEQAGELLEQIRQLTRSARPLIVNQAADAVVNSLEPEKPLGRGATREMAPAALLGQPRFEIQPVFDGERLPNVVVANDGTVLAVWGWGKVRVRRSEDGGRTWGPEIAIAEGLHSGGAVVDENTGDILVFTEEKHPPAPLHVFRSTDHGKTWTKQDVVVHPDENGNVPSMCMNEHGITLRHGEHAGRLLRPSRCYAGGNGREHWPQHYTNAVYSDDGGKTWHTSAPFPALGTGEATLAELADGRIYYNSRRHLSTDGRNPRRRHIAHSNDGGQTWKGLSVSDVLPDGDQHRDYGLMAGLVRLPVAGRDILVFSNIESPKGRHNGHVWASFDGGATWPLKRQVEKGSFAYSSLAAGRPQTPSDGWIYLLYEGAGGGRIARFNLAWLLEGELTGDGEVPELK